MAQRLQQQLKEVGSKLESPPASKDTLLKLLKQAAASLSELDQSPAKQVLESMQSFQNAIVKPEFLKHQDKEVKLLVATCICEITRVTAPEAPYNDEVLKDIFHLIVSTFDGLRDTKGPSFGRRVIILETLARYRSCVVMLDLECDDLVNELFSTFFEVASDEHSDSVLASMQTIMVVLLEESEDVREDLLLIVLSAFGRDKKDMANAARNLAMNVVRQCAGKLEPSVKQFLISSISGERSQLQSQIDYHEIIYGVYCCAPQILAGVVPYVTGELLTEKADIRLKAVGLVGDLFALPGTTISETFRPVFLEFLKRLTDRVVEVRMSVLEHIKLCLLSEPSRVEAPQIISALCNRLLDYEENIRKQVVAVISDVACFALQSISVETVKLLGDRLRDKSLLVKKCTMEKLSEIYKTYCLKVSDGSMKNGAYDWIPGKILRCFYDKDFRSDTVEQILCTALFPAELSVRDKVIEWIRLFSRFDKIEVKTLEKILEQKQRLQQEIHKYLSLRQLCQENDVPEIRKRIVLSFRIMSRCFTDPIIAEENFLILDQLKDASVWKILTSLLDPNTSSLQATSSRNELLSILGEKHRLYEFLGTLSIKCSYMLFNKDYIKDFLLEADIQKAAGNEEYTASCMNILVVLACFSPSLLSGIEEDLVHFLEDDNEVIKEGVLHVLAKAGGTIREQLGVSSSSLDLILERVCIEGNRRQAKYAVHALAAVTKDDGLKSLSVLYKRLVDMLEEKTNLPAVLQSLGCIAQTAMPVFETRESEIDEFIKRDILECSQKTEDNAQGSWDDRSVLCSLKIIGVKTLVKSYLPIKDAPLRSGIADLINILQNIISFGEISEKIESSSVDKAHLRLASAKGFIRLSKHWDHKIPVDVLYKTLQISDPGFPEVKKLFLKKVHQYIKDRVLDTKFACAFLLDIGSQQPCIEEEKHYLSDIVQMCHLGKARLLSIQSDVSSPVVYPEYILPYLVHALAHHSLFPNVDECKEVKAFETVYRKLHLFLSMSVYENEAGKSEANFKEEEARLIISIFHSIKLSEDAVDAAKSKNLYGLCDLGLSITKSLARKKDDLLCSVTSVFLPPELYKPVEKKVDLQVIEGKTWLANQTVLAHFESLKLEANGYIPSEAVEDEDLKDSETDGNEVPLGKLIKRLKAKGAKARKLAKNGPLSAGDSYESAVDILGMVREINLDNLGVPVKFESSNGHDRDSEKEEANKKNQRKRMSGESINVSVPKRQRSSSAHRFSFSKNISKGFGQSGVDSLPKESATSLGFNQMEEGLPGSEDKASFLEGVNGLAVSDVLVSDVQYKGRGSDNRNSRTKGFEEIDDHYLKKPKMLGVRDGLHASSNPKSGSSQKGKRKSIAGLAKCTSKEGESHTTDLIDCRIKVWWPMDKQFYEGVVKSYDHEKKKHVVLYKDGDVEVLRLDKERWELIGTNRKPLKGVELSKRSHSKGRLSEKKNKASSSPRQAKKSVLISPSPKAHGKRTPRKYLNQGSTWVAERNTLEHGSRENPYVSDAEAATLSKVDDLDSEEEVSVWKGRSLPESAANKKPVSEGKNTEDAESSPSDSEQLDKTESELGQKQFKTMKGASGDASGYDGKELSHSGEEQPQNVLREKPSAEGEEKEKSDSKGIKEKDTGRLLKFPEESNKSSASDDSNDAELSDDEPLSSWRSRIGK